MRLFSQVRDPAQLLHCRELQWTHCLRILEHIGAFEAPHEWTEGLCLRPRDLNSKVNVWVEIHMVNRRSRKNTRFIPDTQAASGNIKATEPGSTVRSTTMKSFPVLYPSRCFSNLMLLSNSVKSIETTILHSRQK